MEWWVIIIRKSYWNHHFKSGKAIRKIGKSERGTWLPAFDAPYFQGLWRTKKRGKRESVMRTHTAKVREDENNLFGERMKIRTEGQEEREEEEGKRNKWRSWRRGWQPVGHITQKVLRGASFPMAVNIMYRKSRIHRVNGLSSVNLWFTLYFFSPSQLNTS